MDDKQHPGWIKLWRQLLDTAIWGNRDLVCLFVYCLLKANHSETWVNIKGHSEPVKVMAGQFITGQHSLHRGLCNEGESEAPSSRTVWRWLHSLQSLQMLQMDTSVSNRFTIVTICNWERYQAIDDDVCQAGVKPVSSTCQAGVKGVSTGKKVKKVKNVKKEKTNNMPEIPDYLKVAWPDWVASRKEQKKPLTPTAVKLQLKRLAEVDEATAIRIVEYSAMNNYQGLIFDRFKQRTSALESPEAKRSRKAHPLAKQIAKASDVRYTDNITEDQLAKKLLNAATKAERLTTVLWVKAQTGRMNLSELESYRVWVKYMMRKKDKDHE